MNVLIDTNVLISAALRDRLPERVVLYVATQENWRWLVTPDILSEYVGVLQRPKFGLSTELLQRWMELIQLRAVAVPNPAGGLEFSRDPKDVPMLAAAIANNADYIVTGDKDLTAAQHLVTAKVLSVSEFAAQFSIV